MIISVEFSKAGRGKPSGLDLYKKAISDNPAWKGEIDSIVKSIFRNPQLGRSDAVLSDLDRTEMKTRNFEELTKDKEYRKAKARSAVINNRDRLVFTVKNITSYKHLDFHLIQNDSSEFKVNIPKEIQNETKQTFKSGKYQFLVISEVGGHYLWKNTAILYDKSSDLSWLEAAFAPDNLSG